MEVSLNAHNHDEFLEQFPLGSFLQGTFWKKFLILRGKKVWQLGVYDNQHLLAHCLIYTNKLFLGKSYLYAPKGPFFIPSITEDQLKESLELILSQIRDITIATRKREEIFCRIEPNIPTPDLASIMYKSSAAIQPKTTTYLELRQPIDQLFGSFKEKTRYNIRLAEKKGITIHWSQDHEGLRHFLSLLDKSKKRNRIRSHANKYYELLLQADEHRDTIFISWALSKGVVIAANMYITKFPTMTYLHGGFDYRYRQLMAPYLLQWEAIKRAKEQDLGYFDFWGYTPSDGSKPSWAGVSRFKEGFGGAVIESPGCFDFIYNPIWYETYEKAQRLRRILHI